MTDRDRLAEIKARRADKCKQYPPQLRLMDMGWLIDEVERLREREAAHRRKCLGEIPEERPGGITI